jgi:hypothetical protein
MKSRRRSVEVQTLPTVLPSAASEYILLHLALSLIFVCRSASRRSSAACELSKGALRALRAQARQQTHGSGDWSDMSASVSRAASIDQDSVSVSMMGGQMRHHDLYDTQNIDMPYLSDASIGGHQGYYSEQIPKDQQGNGMGYMHPGMNWAYHQSLLGHEGDGAAYPQYGGRSGESMRMEAISREVRLTLLDRCRNRTRGRVSTAIHVPSTSSKHPSTPSRIHDIRPSPSLLPYRTQLYTHPTRSPASCPAYRP